MSQRVGDFLFLVRRDAPGEPYCVDEYVVWGTQKTETYFGKQGYLALVDPLDEDRDDLTEDDVVFFKHGEAQYGLAGAFEDENIAYDVADYLNNR